MRHVRRLFWVGEKRGAPADQTLPASLDAKVYCTHLKACSRHHAREATSQKQQVDVSVETDGIVLVATNVDLDGFSRLALFIGRWPLLWQLRQRERTRLCR